MSQAITIEKTTVKAQSLANTYRRSHEELRRRKMVKRAHNLCIFICGQPGTGKTTFINTLCDKSVFDTQKPNPDFLDAHEDKEVEVKIHRVDICEEENTIINLSIVEAPEFGKNVNNSDCGQKLVEFLESQFESILNEESRINRNPKFVDNRVHVVLYFIAANANGLRILDIKAMKALSKRANVLPIIGKADMLTDEELKLNKRLIREDIDKHQIEIYDFNSDLDEEYEEILGNATSLKDLVPFAVIGSNEFCEENGQLIRGRKYPWGIVKVDDTRYSDFVALKTILFGSHLYEFRDITDTIIYEKYRAETLKNNYNMKFKNVDMDPLLLKSLTSATDDISKTSDPEVEELQKKIQMLQLQLKMKASEVSSIPSDCN